MARRWSADHGLRPDDLVVPRATLDDLLGKLYCLQAAVEDVDRDLDTDDGPEEVRAALGWLLENARPLQDAWVDPVAPDG